MRLLRVALPKLPQEEEARDLLAQAQAAHLDGHLSGALRGFGRLSEVLVPAVDEVLGEAGIVVRTFELVRFGDPARRPDDDAVERAHQAAARVRELTRR